VRLLILKKSAFVSTMFEILFLFFLVLNIRVSKKDLYYFLHHTKRGSRQFQSFYLEEKIIKEIEQNQLTGNGHVQRMAEGRLPKIALKWMPKQKRARGRPK